MSRLILIAAFIIPLAACTPLGVQQDDDAALQNEIRALQDAGDHHAAAERYLLAAQQAKDPQRRHLLQLHAVTSLVRAGETQRARELFAGIPENEVSGDAIWLFPVNRAALALADGLPDQALAELERVPATTGYRAEVLELRAQALLQNSAYHASARARIELDGLLTDRPRRLANQLAIWDTVNNLTDNELQELRTAPPPDPLSGWLELVELTRLYLQQPDALADVIPHWQQRYPGVAVRSGFLDRLMETLRMAGRPPASIAVLLPVSGSLSAPATAIRDGILAAYYDAPDQSSRPTLRFLDSGDSAESAVTAYLDAASAGAEFVIGPLRKEAVAALATLEPLSVPVLALNTAGDDTPARHGLYQFGLAPEDEAREAARLAHRNGYNRALALIPDGDWGARVYAAFADEWAKQGGTVAEQQQYAADDTDHGDAIQAALNLDNSIARHRDLVRMLGTRLEFEPRRRQDISFVFLVASPRQARLIRPQLSFYRASRVPVYSTSRVYSGIPDPSRDADMNGITFCDMPWTLEQRENWAHLHQSIDEFWPAGSERYTRLYALGIDAYRVVPYLVDLNSSMLAAYHGVSGTLSLDTHGKLQRSLRCAEFRAGVPAVLEPVDAVADREPH